MSMPLQLWSHRVERKKFEAEKGWDIQRMREVVSSIWRYRGRFVKAPAAGEQKSAAQYCRYLINYSSRVPYSKKQEGQPHQMEQRGSFDAALTEGYCTSFHALHAPLS